MLKRNHVLLVSCLIVLVSNYFLYGADDRGKNFIQQLKQQFETGKAQHENKQEPIKFTELQRIKVAVSFVALSPSGNRLAVSLENENRPIIVYKKNEKGQYEQRSSYLIENFEANGIVLHPDDDSNQLACWGYGNNKYKTYLITPTFDLLHHDQVRDGAYSPDGSQFANIQYDHDHELKVSIWNTKTKQLCRKIDLDNEFGFNMIQYHNDSNILMVLGYKYFKDGDGSSKEKDHIAYAINLENIKSRVVRIFDGKFENALITTRGNVVLCPRKLLGYEDELFDYNVLLASACDLLSKRNITIVDEKLGPLVGLDDSAGPRYLYTQCNGPSISVWRLDDNEKKEVPEVATLLWHYDAKLSTDGRVVVGVGYNELTVYQVEKEAVTVTNNCN